MVEPSGNVAASREPDISDFEHAVADRFALVPNFFASAPDAPEIVEKLWDFAKAAYIDSPIPTLFKERLFVSLSRFCEVRYCIIRHCAFLLGYGHAAGDPSARLETIAQAIKLLRAPPPWDRNNDTWLHPLETKPPLGDWPAPETEPEEWLFAAAAQVFVEPARSDRARQALRHALGGRRFEHLMGLLAFIRTAHYWTKIHPDLSLEQDVRDLLRLNEELARLLLEDPEAARCDMGSRLFTELQELRTLHEREELKKAKHALELQVAQKEMLLKEVNHRVKNSLQIISSILQVQMAHTENVEAVEAMRSAGARIFAIAAVHERLFAGDDVSVVPLNTFLGDLSRNIGGALGCPEGIEIDLEPVIVPTDTAFPLALIVNELITNAIKYVGPPCRITMQGESDNITIRISDSGSGPTEGSGVGTGSRIVQAVAGQIGARIGTHRDGGGYTVEIAIARPPQQ